MTLTLGIDVSQDYLDVAIKLEKKDTPFDLGRFPNTPDGFKKLKKKLTKELKKANACSVCIVIEPSGGYEQSFARFAYKENWRVCMPNPHHVRQWAKGTGKRAKTDRVDARILALYGSREQLHDWKPLPDEIYKLDTLLKRLEELKATLQQEKNRHHTLSIQEVTDGPVIESLERTIKWLQQETEKLQEEIDNLLQEFPDLKKKLDQIKTAPGVGPINGLFLLVLLSRFHNLAGDKANPKALTAYVGLDPVVHESGKSRKRSLISKMGNPKVRSLLFMGAMAAINGENHLNILYRKLLGRNKAKKVALIAVARKILLLTWAIFRDGSEYSPKIAESNMK